MRRFIERKLFLVDKMRSFLDHLYVIYYFKSRFRHTSMSGFRKKTASQIVLSVSERSEIKKLWRGLCVNDYWFRWYKYIDSLRADNSFGSAKISHYIPDDIYFIRFCGYFSNPQACRFLDDKNMYDLYFHDVRQPRTFMRKVKGCYLDGDYRKIPQEDVVNCFHSRDSLIIKPSVSSSGG